MSKVLSKYVCQNCAYESPRWAGKCPNCGEWNTFVEELTQKISARKVIKGVSVEAIPLSEVDVGEDERIPTTIAEFDRVLGGGIVRGSVVLLGGDPGVGKSTLMLQLAAKLTKHIVLYISGEESAKQIKLRAERFNCSSYKTLLVLAETNVDVIAEVIERSPPDIIIVDSIQTMYRPQFESSPGSVAQVREVSAVFTRIAKERSIPVFLIGHVTKEGIIAGPKVIEHMVDTVLYFEGERHLSYRILRAVKNRYGSTNEIGVFEMMDRGLTEVENPSLMLISGRPKNTSGTCVACVMEGSRPILAEVQGLVTPTGFGTPRRMATGFDYNRMSMLLAVLEKRAGYFFGNMDAYINIVGGLKISDPALDLAACAAIISSNQDKYFSRETIVLGEVGLGGEVRNVSRLEMRLKEAERLGFKTAIIPDVEVKAGKLKLTKVKNLSDLIALIK